MTDAELKKLRELANKVHLGAHESAGSGEREPAGALEEKLSPKEESRPL